MVSTERKSGWLHDLYFPGYLWADTEGKWIVPDMTYNDGMASCDLDYFPLIQATEELQRQESALGQWSLGGTSLPFGKEVQEQFPLVGRFLDEEGQATNSQISPDRVTRVFERVFD